ncbi:hypothetical protein ES963_16460 [Bacillus subtilis]|uniref:hypothetical protein n=1 Tax=Bacillus subtilis TaxID=1423 RepID=UPI00100A186B|nr:hypothetical protein [Bacillus subtilis]QAV89605.1 hypothetical protein ES963_16460 [Bacillus subtilis]
MKPTITKEQADVLLRLYSEGWTRDDILIYHLTVDWGKSCSALNDLDILTLAAALVNGYEVKKTPEEKVRELYNHHRHEAACSFTDEGTNLSLGKAFGIKEASKVFGVDVEGWDEFDNV